MADPRLLIPAVGLPRRAVLASAALAAGGLLADRWGRRTTAAAIEGTIVGAADARGHALRHPETLPPPGGTERTAVVVVGTGVAGLAAAWRLARHGVRDLLLFELEDQAGGNARAGRSAATAYPWGAHYLPLPGPEAGGVRDLLRELGVIERVARDGRVTYEERYLCHAPQERLYLHGRWQQGLFPWLGADGADLAQYRAFRAAMADYRAWRDGAGRRAFAVPRAAGAPGAFAELDRLSIAVWLDRQGLRSPRLRWYVDYACRDDFGTGLAETSAWAAIHYYAARDPDPEYGDVVLTWPEGNAWLTTRLLEPVREALRTAHVVFNVEPGTRGVAVDALDVAAGRSRRVLAREVILAVPVLVAARLYRPWRERPPAFVGAFRYAPWLVANLHLVAPPPDPGPAAPAWDNVLYESPGLGYVVATHQALGPQPPATVWTYYRSFPGPDPAASRRWLLAAPWPTLRDAVLADLGRAHPDLPSHVRRLDVMRYGHAMVRPEVGFVCGPARAAAARTLRGPVHLAHADLSGFSLFEEAFDWGTRAAARVLARLGRATG